VSHAGEYRLRQAVMIKVKSMKLLINTVPLLAPRTGVGNYIYHIARQLLAIIADHKFVFYYGYPSRTLYSSEDRFYWNMVWTVKHLMQRLPYSREILYACCYALFQRRLRGVDVYFEPNFIPLDIPARKLVTTIMDFSFHRYPEWHPKYRIAYFQANFWQKIHHADIIIVPSHYIAQEARELLPEENGKIRTVHLGIDHHLFHPYPPEILQKFKCHKQLPGKFILFTGSIEPRKNLLGLLRAYDLLANDIKKEYKLVLAGFEGWNNQEIMQWIGKNQKDISYLGYVSDIELAYLYNLASMLVLPSFYEGFGLPPLEAMACGTPTVVSRVASLPEICGDAASYVNPHEPSSIAEAITNLARHNDICDDLRRKGLTQAQQFSWEKSAREHLEIFQEVSGR
jgi:glycosyltransferase involved in cell wall biosynthesis